MATKYILNSDDVFDTTFWSTANADSLIAGLNAAATISLSGASIEGLSGVNSSATIDDDRTWTIAGGKTLTITGGPVLFEGSSLTVETVGNLFGTNQTVISSSDSAGSVNVIAIRNADYTAGGATGYNANLLNTDFFSINPDLTNIGFAGDINFDGTAFGLGGGAMTVDVTNGTITGSSSGAIINAYNATMTGPWSFADGAGVSDSGAAGANWTFNAGNSGTPANDSLARTTYTHSTADPNWRGLWMSINAPVNDGGSSSKDDSSYPRNFLALEQSYLTGGVRYNEFHVTLNDNRLMLFVNKDLDSNFASGGFAVPTTVGVPAANTSGEPALKVIDARPVSNDAMKAILWNQAATGTSGSVQVVMRGDQIGSDDGTHQNYWSILAGAELDNTRSLAIRDELSGGGTRLYIEANGNIGIGNTAPTSKLDVTGTVTATAFVGTGTINSSSVIDDNCSWLVASNKLLTIAGGVYNLLKIGSAGIAIESSANTALTVTSNAEIGSVVSSATNIGAQIYTLAGAYHAMFGDEGDNRCAIERLRGSLVWFFYEATGRLKTSETLTGDRNWTLPDKSGTVAMTSDIRITSEVGDLPAAADNVGVHALVTDATSWSAHAAPTGGGSEKVMVYSNGTIWAMY